MSKILKILTILLSNSILLFFSSTLIAQENISVIAFGDSITQGVQTIQKPGNGRRVGGYEPKLEDYFSSVGKTAYVYNYGIAGESTVEGLSRINNVIQEQPADYILILEGTNDIWDRISYHTTVFNLEQMIERSRAQNVTPLIATLTPDPRVSSKNIPTTYNPAIRELAERKSVMLADQYDHLVDYWYFYTDASDRLHPNEIGYQAMAEVWFYALTTITKPATNIFASSATLWGMVNNSEAATSIFFEYGSTPTFGSTIVATSATNEAEGIVEVFAKIAELQPETQYYYRVGITVYGKTTYGCPQSFITSSRKSLSWLNLLLKN